MGHWWHSTKNYWLFAQVTSLFLPPWVSSRRSIPFLRPVAAPRSEGDMGRRGWVTNLLYDARPGQNGPMEKNSQYGGRPYYYNELFLDMQHIVDFVFISKVAEQGLSFE